MVKKMFTLLIAVLFVVPFVVLADDFDDDFGGEDEESEESEEDEEAPAKVSDESEGDAAMRDLMGEPAEQTAPKQQASSENKAADKGKDSESQKGASLPKGLKPVMLVKGSFTVMGSYKYKDENGALKNGNAMFGSVDEGILGLEYAGEHVIAKGTLNLRTDNALISKNNGEDDATNNPLIKENLHSIQNGAANAIYEMYGGIKFFDVFIKAGKMLPEYGLVDTWQNLGMGFATPFLTRSLVVVEGFIPETDAGIALGYNGVIKNDHNLIIGLSLGTGNSNSEFWHSDKTYGLYGRVGYGFKEFIKAAVGFQYRSNFYNQKTLNLTGIGVHLKGAYAGFEMPLTFDYNMIGMINSSTGKKTTKNGMLLSLAPGYGYDLSKHVEWLDKVAVAVRFDLAQGIYKGGTTTENYLDSLQFKQNKMYFRIGVTANVFTKEFGGVRGMAGFTFLMQPKAKLEAGEKDYGFSTFVIQAGAEY